MPYVGEIRIFAGSFAPVGWAICDGSPQLIVENETLYQAIGTTYGGDGMETFNLPDLRGRVPIHMGSGGGGTYQIGTAAGTEQVTLTTQQIPTHNHAWLVSTGPATSSTPAGRKLGESGTANIYLVDTPDTSMNAQIISPVGGSQPHENLQPYTAINYIISLFGQFPSPT